MKTAMDELISIIDRCDPTWVDNIPRIRNHAINLLKMEKQQILDAFEEGTFYSNDTSFLNQEDYYNRTYNEDE